MEQALTNQSPVGEIEELSGNVTITHADGSVEQAEEGMPIFEGDVIETDASGAVNVYFADESNISLSENANFSVDEFNYDAQSGSGESDFSMIRGLFVYTSGVIGREDPDDVTIDTPIGSIGIRGTIIAGQINENGQDADITVMEGAIVVRNDTGEVTLSSPFETVSLSGRDAPIGDVRQISPEDFTVRFASMHNVNSRFFSSIQNDRGQGEDQTGEDAANTPAGEDGTENLGEDTGEEMSEDAGEDTAPDDAPEDTAGNDDAEPAADAEGEGEPAPEGDAEPAADAATVPAANTLSLDTRGSLDLRPAVEAIKAAIVANPTIAIAEPIIAARTTLLTDNEPSDNVVTNETPVNNDDTPLPETTDSLVIVHGNDTIAENAPLGTTSLISFIGQPLAAQNYDTVQYTLLDNYNNFFRLINLGNTAKLIYTGAVDAYGNGLDYEHIDQYNIKILAVAGDQSVTHSFDVNILDVQEAPHFNWNSMTESIDRMEFTSVQGETFSYDLRSAFWDEDIGEIVSFSFATGGGNTNISLGAYSSGVISDNLLKISLDACETDFNFTIIATDSEGNTTNGTFNLSVLDATYSGTSNDDLLLTCCDADIYRAKEGDDIIEIGNTYTIVFGNEGDDEIEFNSGSYYSRGYGDEGNDTFIYNATTGGGNIGFGGIGNDQFYINHINSFSQYFQAHGGAGNDTFFLSSAAFEILALNASSITGGIGIDTIKFTGSFSNAIDLTQMLNNIDGIETLDFTNANTDVRIVINEDVLDEVLGHDGDIYIKGDTGDEVIVISDINGSYIDQVLVDGQYYDHYQSANGHDNLYIDSDITLYINANVAAPII